ncbi:uncharacterized protein LOC123921311 isoform X2 [Trifolium pratense]|uniref:uncharacterized protein LOC123895693 isoform X2 n=1 Tax=Trifolium pratense TaxID=57577 RepID=UPI001E692369|nr:uncharacterized protein LOC123895693 isoform X2 [Trifolium pratense]XP_045829758.1 uncharacterized protein LOC123921311 isoform X2 [Trifolium pratense]
MVDGDVSPNSSSRFHLSQFVNIHLSITFSILFVIVIAFVSDGLSTVPDKASVLSSNTSFSHEFHEHGDQIIKNCFRGKLVFGGYSVSDQNHRKSQSRHHHKSFLYATDRRV